MSRFLEANATIQGAQPTLRRLYVLGGGIHKDESDGRLRPTRLTEGDQYGLLGGIIRVEAAVKVFSAGMVEEVVFTGGKSAKNRAKYGNGIPYEAEIYRNAFLEKMSSDHGRKEIKDVEERTRTIVSPMNTYEEVQSIVKEIEGDEGLSGAFILSNAYHILRVMVFCRDFGNARRVKFIPAEDIIIAAYPERKEEILRHYKSPRGMMRVAAEASGIDDKLREKYYPGEFQKKGK